jgi:uncharacterized protein YcbK (DUF882 family)
MIARRRLLGIAAAAIAAPRMAAAQADPIGDLLGSAPPQGEVRRLNLFNLHTFERFDAVYWEKGEYIPQALDAINLVLRDFRTGDVWPIDVNLLDAVSAVAARVENDRPFQIVSGFRSAKTNAMLRSRSTEVAENSVHTQGEAIDLYLDDTPLSCLHAAAVELKAGGVGLYPTTGFIHMDVAQVRYWQGT